MQQPRLVVRQTENCLDVAYEYGQEENYETKELLHITENVTKMKALWIKVPINATHSIIITAYISRLKMLRWNFIGTLYFLSLSPSSSHY